MKSEELLEIIRSRRTQKDFDGTPLKDSEIQQLLEAANWAPNHRLNQPWRFRVFRSQACLQLTENFKSRVSEDDRKVFEQPLQKLARVGALIFVSHQVDSDEKIQLENYAACCAGIQNMLLLATAMGYQSYWSTSKLFQSSQMLNLIDFSKEERFVGAIWFGKSAKEVQPKTRKAVEEFTQCFK